MLKIPMLGSVAVLAVAAGYVVADFERDATLAQFAPARIDEPLRADLRDLTGTPFGSATCAAIFVCRLDCGACRAMATASQDSAVHRLWLLPDSVRADVWSRRYDIAREQALFPGAGEVGRTPTCPLWLGFNATPTRVLLSRHGRILDFVVTREPVSRRELNRFCTVGPSRAGGSESSP